MILPSADISVVETKSGKIEFRSSKCDLSKNSLFIPVRQSESDPFDTVEFNSDHIVYHSANGDSEKMTAREFLELDDFDNDSDDHFFV